jgi:threonine dehydrogenase-like Zn-dependent dehydrogenase
MSLDRVEGVVFAAAQRAEFAAIPVETSPLGGNEVAGRTLVSLVSPGTELNSAYLGEKFPAYPGYAAVFEADAVGSDVKDIRVGDRLFTTGPHGIGGHRSRQRCPREACIPVPAGLAPEIAVHARLMGVSMSTLTTTPARPPDRVMVLGLGPVGHLAAQVFQACGYRVTAVEPVEGRRRLAEEKGIERVLAAAPVKSESDLENFSLALECSGHEQAVLSAVKAVRKKGEVVLVAIPWRRKTDLYAFDFLNAIFRGYVVLRSGWEWEVPRHGAEFREGSVFGNLAAAVRWLAEGRVRADGLFEMASPRDGQRVYQDLLNGRCSRLSFVFDWRTV